MEDTASLAAPGTAAPPEATGEVFDLAPDSANGIDVATETEGEAEATDSGFPDGSEWEGLAPHQIAERVAEQVAAKEREVEARKEESFRQREENARRQATQEQARQMDHQARQRAVQVRAGAAYEGLVRAISPALKEAFDAGHDAPDPAKVIGALNLAARQVADATATEMLDAFRMSFTPEMRERFGDDFTARLDPANAAAIQHAFDTRNLREVVRTVLDAAEHLSGHKARTRAEAEAAAKVVHLAEKKSTSPRQPSPTRAGTTAGGKTFTNAWELDTAFANNEIDASTYRRLRGNLQYT